MANVTCDMEEDGWNEWLTNALVHAAELVKVLAEQNAEMMDDLNEKGLTNSFEAVVKDSMQFYALMTGKGK